MKLRCRLFGHRWVVDESNLMRAIPLSLGHEFGSGRPFPGTRSHCARCSGVYDDLGSERELMVAERLGLMVVEHKAPAKESA